ncbi:hypothetical protein BDQ12DRAFT_706795 [Crucibulum laeve]|uniref:Uncharacterized protein n=1 Tax=Crucibulum laeve TaxID=68775 RepID=A0A5C3LPA8_9AGAR|nr:hypothetical protein BDQ12DRAFT_706795 [Crucibulum laeve]
MILILDNDIILPDNLNFCLTLSCKHLPTLRNGIATACSLPATNANKTHASSEAGKDATLYFEGIRLLADPDFLHVCKHPRIHESWRPSVDLEDLSIDVDIDSKLRRDIPIITMPHAQEHLSHKSEHRNLTAAYALDHYENGILSIGSPSLPTSSTAQKVLVIKVTAMPGKHVPPGPAHLLETMDEALGAVPPTNGWMVEFGYENSGSEDNWQCGYRIYISGNILLVDELKEILGRCRGKQIDLMLIRLGGTIIPGSELVGPVNPEVTILSHYDPLNDFKKAVEEAGLDRKVVYLDSGDSLKFDVVLKQKTIAHSSVLRPQLK